MATVIPTTPPRSFVRGSTVKWRIQASDYPPATWTVTVAFVAENDAQQVTATDYGDGTHLVTLDNAASKAFQAGHYRFQVYASDGSARYTVAQGVLEVREDYAAVSSGHDGRSSAAVIYDAITAVLMNKANHDQQSLAIGDRSLSRYSWEELSQMRGHYAHQMTDGERMARGFAPRAPVSVRFIR